jgi:hypothetical protein
LPAETAIYTNLPEPVYMLTGRNAPFRVNSYTGAPVPVRETELQFDEIRQQVRLAKAVAVYFLRDPDWLPWMFDGPALAAHCGFTGAIEFEDATVYMGALGVPAASPLHNSPRAL